MSKRGSDNGSDKSREQERIVHAVDLDGTLAMQTEHDFDPSISGDPVPALVERVKAWLDRGEEVVIFTARVSEETPEYRDVERVRGIIEDWCEDNIGRRLPVTAHKSYRFHDIWDDRAVQVIVDTGTPLMALVKQLREELERLEAGSTKRLAKAASEETQ